MTLCLLHHEHRQVRVGVRVRIVSDPMLQLYHNMLTNHGCSRMIPCMS